jgi:hypothetical protein
MKLALTTPEQKTIVDAARVRTRTLYAAAIVLLAANLLLAYLVVRPF